MYEINETDLGAISGGDGERLRQAELARPDQDQDQDRQLLGSVAVNPSE